MDLRTVRVPESVTVGLAAGIGGVVGSFALTGGGPEFIAVPVNAVVVSLMPAPIVTFSILVLGKLGEAIGFGIAIAILVALLGLVGVASSRIGRLPWERAWLTGGLVWIIAVALTNTPWYALGPAIAAGLPVWMLERTGPPASLEESRRRFIKAVGGTLAVGGGTVLLWNEISAPGETAPLSELLADTNPSAAENVEAEISRRFEAATAAELDIDGFPGLVSPIEEFYEVDINVVNPEPAAEDWSLSVTGMVENEFEIGYDEILAMEPEHRFVTLRCVSDSVNGDLIDNAIWTGVPVEPLLERAQPQGEQVLLRAVDDYYEDFPLDAFQNGFLAYGMNGRSLPRSHGYPVRALVLGHWGEVNVKWLTEIEIVGGNVVGYWEQRGWHGTGPVHPVAKIWGDNRLEDGRLQVYGYAYGGTRGVSSVEVSIDDGQTWNEARLSDPLEGRDVWRQWSYAWPAEDRSYQVIARMIDGDGTVQSRDRTNPHPSGATGWVRTTVSG